MKKIIINSLIVFVSILGFTHNVFATSIISQTISSSVKMSPLANTVNQRLGTGLSGQLKNIDFYASVNDSSTQVFDVYVSCFDTSSYTSGSGSCTNFMSLQDIGNSDNYLTFNNVKTLYTKTFESDSIIFDSAKYYRIQFLRKSGAGDVVAFYGSSTCSDFSNVENGGLYTGTGNTGKFSTPCNIYFDIDSGETCSDGIKNQDETGIDFGGICGDFLTNESQLSIIYPEMDENYSSPVNISGKYYQNNITNYNNILLYIVSANTDFQQTKLVPISTNQTNDGNWNTDILLDDGYYYLTARLYNSNNYTFGAWYPPEDSFALQFSIGDILIPEEIGECGTFDIICYIKKGASWLFLPSRQSLENFNNLTLENSLPFSYIYDMENLYEEVFDDTPQDIDISIDFLDSELTLISTDKLEEIPFQGTIRTVLGALMIFGTAMLLYRRVITIHDKQEVKI